MKRLNNKGITLIALVITIIVLLILAGVTIATLTGDNGILTRATEASEETQRAEAIEKAKLDISVWKADKVSNGEDSTLTDSIVQQILTGKDYVDGEPGTTSFVSITGYTISYADLYDRISTIAEEKAEGTVFLENTTLQDDYGNTIKVPEGFKIANDSATDVTVGVVIEDATEGKTKGSQFVWIPVGTVYKNVEQTDFEIIKLSRYKFDDLGNPTDEGDDIIYPSSFSEAVGIGYTELLESNSGVSGAKDITAFLSTVESSHGYYIGRYEARTPDNEISPTENYEELPAITVKPNDYVYNYVTQPQASQLSQEMYLGKNFTSDLVNSYAWDTTIVFIQAFGDDDYSVQPSLNLESNIGLAEQGTNNEETQYQDKVCNIWDIASNCREFTTEECIGGDTPVTFRGGGLWNSDGPKSRMEDFVTVAGSDISFRPILYL